MICRSFSLTACLKRAYKSIECSKLLHCADSYDMYGVCIGECKEGFLGDYCLGRGEFIHLKRKTTLSL